MDLLLKGSQLPTTPLETSDLGFKLSLEIMEEMRSHCGRGNGTIKVRKQLGELLVLFLQVRDNLTQTRQLPANRSIRAGRLN
jgi:hypothetical protein